MLAIDGSPDSTVAAAAAAVLDQTMQVGIHIVHCWQVELWPYDPTGGLSIEPTATYEKAAATLLREQSALLKTSGAVVTGEDLIQGVPAEAILDLAQKLDASLVVLGSRGQGLARRVALGSVSQAVVHHTQCPVLVVRGGAAKWPPRVIIAGDDGSAASKRAALMAGQIALATGARLRIVSVIPYGWVDAVSASRGREAEAAASTAEGMLNRVARQVQDVTGVKAAGSILAGNAASTLLNAARRAPRGALLAVGTRGLGPLRRFALGSVSNRVLHEAPASVLICPA